MIFLKLQIVNLVLLIFMEAMHHFCDKQLTLLSLLLENVVNVFEGFSYVRTLAYQIYLSFNLNAMFDKISCNKKLVICQKKIVNIIITPLTLAAIPNIT